MALVGACLALSASGCAFDGLNSLPLPGAVGRGPGPASTTSRSPTSSTGTEFTGHDRRRRGGQRRQMTFTQLARRRRGLGQARCRGSRQRGGQRRANQPAGLHAFVARPTAGPGPDRAVANPAPPSAEQPHRPIRRPSRTLASLSAVVNGGGLGQIGDIIHNAQRRLVRTRERRSAICSPVWTPSIGTLDAQHDNIVATIGEL